MTVVALPLACFPLTAGAQAQIGADILVGVRAAADTAAETSYLATFGSIVYHFPPLGYYHIHLPAGSSTGAALAQIASRPEVRYAEVNGTVQLTSPPNDYYYVTVDNEIGSYRYGLLWQWAPEQIHADSAWAIWKPAQTVVIAVVDTGIDNTHRDLTNVILRDPDNTIEGYNAILDAYPNEKESDAMDDYGHGTHVSGIAAAQTDNSAGIAGIAGWNGAAGATDTSNVKLMPVKVLDSTGSGTPAELADGIHWAADNGANIISMSVKEASDDPAVNDWLQYAWSAGCLLVAAAGNTGTSAKNYPAADANVISVAASDVSDTLAQFSTWGRWVNVAAPGGQGPVGSCPGNTSEIWSTWLVSGGSYAWDCGTSMACPHVSGEAALIWADSPTLTNSQVSAIITSNWDPVTPYAPGQAIAGGRVNAYDAVAAGGGAPVAGVGGLDGNADADVIVQEAATGAVYGWLLNGGVIQSQAYLKPRSESTPDWKVVGMPDLNGSGRRGVLFQQQSTGAVYYWLVNGLTVTSEGYLWTSPPATTDWKVVATPDLNGDGISDVLLQSQSTGAVFYWLINWNGSVPSIGTNNYLWTSPPATTDWKVVGTGNLDADAYADVLLQSQSTGAVYYWLINWNGSVPRIGTNNYLWTSPPATTDWKVVGLGKLDGDAYDDVLLQSQSTGAVYYWLINWNGSVPSIGTNNYLWTSPPATPDWSVVGVGDIDSDGRADVLLQKSATGSVYYWLINWNGSVPSIGGQGYVR